MHTVQVKHVYSIFMLCFKISHWKEQQQQNPLLIFSPEAVFSSFYSLLIHFIVCSATQYWSKLGDITLSEPV